MKGMQGNNGFLLIKCWGCGFWSDMEHVIGHLLIAELIDRYPIVYWGKESHYCGAENSNAFYQFFLPVSRYTITNLAGADFTYFPAMWHNKPLVEDNPGRYTPKPSWLLELLGTRRLENVVVSDRHVWPADIVSFIPKNHPAYGLNVDDVYRYIFVKYIKLQKDVYKECEDFFRNRMQDSPILAVHVRGGDKIQEYKNLWEVNNLYQREINNYLIAHPSASIFLLTDSEDILAEYEAIYGGKLIYTNCERTVRGDLGVHIKQSNGQRKGIDIIKDTLLALQCDSFIGNAYSNVSIAIRRLKEWKDSEIRMFGDRDLLV